MGNFNPDGANSYLLLIYLLMQTEYPSFLVIHQVQLIPGKRDGHQGQLTIYQ